MIKRERVHFIGICGTAMAPIAKMMKDMGFEVTGSDKGFFPPVSLYLKKNKLNIELGYKKEHITSKLGSRPDGPRSDGPRSIDFVVIGNAVAENNEEVQEVLKRKIPYYSYPEILRKYLVKEKSIVIAGEYGKTTITSAVSFLFYKAGLKPSFMFGGVSLNFKSAVENYTGSSGSGSSGSGSAGFGPIGRISVVEGDEYNSAFYDKRSKFLHYNGKYVLITSLEWDHVDLFPTFDDYIASFKKLVEGIPEDGILFLNKDDKNIHHVVDSAKCKILYYSYMDNSADLYIKKVSYKDGYTEFVTSDPDLSDLKTYKTTLIGKHNLQNLVGAILVARSFGIPYESLKKSIFEFKGVKRRLEIRYRDDDVIIIDDFAHSQVKVKTSIDAVRENFKEASLKRAGSKSYRIIAVFEPDTMSARSRKTLNWYKTVFNNADKVIITDMYRSNSLEEGFSQYDLVNLIKEQGIDASYVSNQDVAKFLYDNSQKNDLILFMSSRNFQGGIDKTVSLFKSKSKSVNTNGSGSKEKLYQCSVCKLHYKDENWALQCYSWCSTNNSCNVAITKHSEERLNRKSGQV